AQVGQKLRPVVGQRQIEARLEPGEHHARMRVEGQHNRGFTGGTGVLYKLADQMLVPAMHAVKRADCHDRRPGKIRVFERSNVSHVVCELPFKGMKRAWMRYTN